jgi:HSP20 family protein
MYQRRNYGLVPRAFGGLLEEMFPGGVNRFTEDVNVGIAPVNIHETDKTYEMQVLAPGIRKEEFKINVEKNVLNVSYDHKEETTEQTGNKWLRTEYQTKSFKRSFLLNDKIDGSNITAKYADGILHVSIAKKEVSEQPVKEVVIN